MRVRGPIVVGPLGSAHGDWTWDWLERYSTESLPHVALGTGFIVSAVRSRGRRSLFGMKSIARSASAQIVRDGLTPTLADTAEPSMTYKPSYPNTRCW